jgi:hypothetical protein
MNSDYIEKHHIIPKCLGGSNEIENIVCLTPEAHYVAHQLLVKIYPDNHKIIKAAHMMTVGRNTNKTYGWLKRKHSESMKQQPSNRKGVKLSAETRNKMSKAHQLIDKSRLHSSESKQKMRESHLGEIKPKSNCIYCNKEVSAHIMKRWHGDNCKFKH